MGTDIHMACEIYKNGKWNLVTENVFPNVWYDPTSKFDWAREQYTNVPFTMRSYDTFAILADVRNGHGFAGCITGDRFNPISEPKGYPEDMSDELKSDDTYLLSYEHSASYFTLKELMDYDWEQTSRTFGVLSEEEYKNSIMKGKKPTTWCGDICGKNVIKVSETIMKAIINGDIPRDNELNYYVGVYFPAETYAEHASWFYNNTIPALRALIPEGGTEEDVRIVFDFDS